ncbi:glycosyltransferase family 2 protein [bacterium]|nr:glycosyltransferase family 2 protein [bacterium]
MDLSIVIVSWNTRELLRGCLASLPAATAGLACEVLVVDNASADGSAAMVRDAFPDAILIESGANLGFSRGNNLALPRAAGDYVLLLNPDTVCPPDSLSRLVAFARGVPRLAVVGPRLVDAAGRPTISGGWFPRARHHWLGALDPRRLLFRGALADRIVFAPRPDEPSHPVEYVMGACFLMPRAALDAVGPLDEGFFMYFEETDWCWRARALGLAAWFCGEVEVAHLEGQAAAAAGSFGLNQFQVSYRRFVRKNYGPGRVWQFRLAQFAEFSVKSLLRRLVPGEENRALSAAYAARARLQLRNEITAEPPGGPTLPAGG